MCIVSFGTVFFVILECSVGLNRIVDTKKTIVPFFQQSGMKEPVDAASGRITLLLSTEIQFPYVIEGTNLVAERVVSYEGPFMEDGSNQEVVNVMGLMLRNIGAEGIIHAEVRLFRESQKFVFKADMIPPGATVLVLEQNRNCYTRQNFTSCGGWQILAAENWQNSGIAIEEIGMGTLAITNRMGEAITQVRLHYKTHLEDILVGGITHTYTVKSLDRGETVFVSPSRYAKGYSCIVKIEVESENHRQLNTVGGG